MRSMPCSLRMTIADTSRSTLPPANLLGIPREQLIGRRVEEFFEVEPGPSFPPPGILSGPRGCKPGRAGLSARAAKSATPSFAPGRISGRACTFRFCATSPSSAKSNHHLLFLFRATSQLLAADQPSELVTSLFREISGELGLELYFNYVVTDDGKRLHLDSYSGVTPETREAHRVARVRRSCLRHESP